MSDPRFPRTLTPVDDATAHAPASGGTPAASAGEDARVFSFDDFRLRSRQKVAVVTGGSSGIGAEIVLDLARDHLVLAVGRDWERLTFVAERAAERYESAETAGPRRGGAHTAGTAEASATRVIPVIADLEDPASLDRIFSDEVAALGRVDVLVHNAAISRRFTVEDARIEDWRESLATNVVGPAELTRVLLPWLRPVKGTVVFIGSGASRVSVPFHTVYSASKHALQALSEGLRHQVAADGIRVSTVAPGPTHTPMAHQDHPYPVEETEERLEPASVARSVRHVVDAPAEASITEVWVRPRS